MNRPTYPTPRGKRRTRSLALIAVAALFACRAFGETNAIPRERLLLDFGWRFHLGNSASWGDGEELDKAGNSRGPARRSFNDASWRVVDLPHDWVVELPFDRNADNGHGSKAVGRGFPDNSIAWYRRTFTLPKEDKGKRLWLEFDGVFRDCRVFVNGYLIGHEESGYSSFRYDITDVANCGGRNTIAVRVDASKFEGWFYEGAGIYRHVWLEKTSPVAIEPDGTFAYTRFKNNVPEGGARIEIESHVANAGTNAVTAAVKCELIGPDGKRVAETSESAKLDASASADVKQSTTVESPVLWTLEAPALYKLVTTVECEGKVTDRTETEFGIRTVAFDANQGFLLNGERVAIMGTCNHQDHAGVGVAIPDRLQYFRVEKLKEMGSNAIRTSHNAPTPELLEACDRLGMLVMDENRILGSDAENLHRLADQVRRDRNHPCVFVWSICNEETTQRSPAAARIAATMQTLVHQLDPTRLCTAAMNSWSSGTPQGVSIPIDVQGFNYLHNGNMDAFHKNNPLKPCIGTEEASAFATRGIYSNSRLYKSAYDDNKPGYGTTAEEWWRYYAARPWASGAFAWTGFDYRGEPAPFGWPNISSEFGILDTCGFPKDPFYYYQAWWSVRPVLHLMPHWNWAGKEGSEIDVRCFGNSKEVELFLNGQSLGKQSMPLDSHLAWKVKYAPGVLSAKGYDGDRVVAEDKVETTGAPAGVKLTADRSTIDGDGEDLSILTVAIVDAQGRIVPTASNVVSFELSGSARIIGVGNGDPVSHEPDVFVPQAASGKTVALDNWRYRRVPGSRDRPEIAEKFDDTTWEKPDVHSDYGPLEPNESAVFRTSFSADHGELTAPAVSLAFGMIDDEGWVYVNGQLVGESHDWSAAPVFEIHKFLHPGDNTIAVVVKNNANSGGLNKGVSLEIPEPSTDAGQWKRSVFSGLAQIIVRAGKSTGEIHLTAHSENLADGAIVITSQATAPRPAVPASD